MWDTSSNLGKRASSWWPEMDPDSNLSKIIYLDDGSGAIRLTNEQSFYH
jgi:hypothetical protein